MTLAEIRPCRKEDLARIAEIHKSQFDEPNALLGQLGPALIAELYGAFLGRSIFLVYQSNGEVNGFVLGGPSRAMVSCRLAFSRKWALACLAEVARRPKLWLRALRSLVTLTGSWFSSMVGASPRDELRLLSIAVVAGATRKGVGKALVESFEAEVGTTSTTYRLNVLKSNASAIRFYEKLAFRRVGETEIAWILRREVAANAALPGSRPQ